MLEVHSSRKLEVLPETVREFALDELKTDFDGSQQVLGLIGWIVQGREAIEALELWSDEVHLRDVPVDIERPDVLKVYPDSPTGARTGFSVYLNPYDFDETFTLEVRARTRDGARTPLHRLKMGRSPVSVDAADRRPLLVTTLGRTGSSHLIALLGSHPGVVVYRPYELEARYISYWSQVFLSLSHPKSWMVPLQADDRSDPGWVFGSDKLNLIHYRLYPEMSGWFQGEYGEALLAFCRQSLAQHYDQVARIRGKEGYRYYCEKFLPGRFTQSVRRLFPTSKEVLLVRDFRDMYCSIRGFNRKRGFDGFGREQFDDDADYIGSALKNGASQLVKDWEERRDRACLVRYEDLILNPEAVLERVFAYLEVDSSPKMVAKVMENARGSNVDRQREHQTSANPTRSVGRYKTELSRQEREICESAFESSLLAFGYPVESRYLRKVREPLLKRLNAFNRLKRKKGF